ncbi:uncharacterized protein LACBIDRAFT_165492, partial [Laccaria bicolor S238N-H82]
VRYTTDNDPYRGDRLSKLAYILLNLFIFTGDVSHLNEAIPIFENAVGTTPDGLSSKPFLLKCQGFALWSRYKRLGDPVDLILAISAYADAVLLTPDSHLKNPWWLDGLAPALNFRFERLRLQTDLDQDILIHNHRAAVHLTSDDDPPKGSRLHDLGHALMVRYKQSGNLIDLNEAITVYQHASRLADGAHPVNFLCHIELTDVLFLRFERLGERDDLDQSIHILKDVLRSIGDDSSRRAICLNQLGVALAQRYQCSGTSSDLHESFVFFKEAVSLADTDTRKVMYLINLSNSQHSLFKCLDDTTSLDESILALTSAAEMLSDAHRMKIGCLTNLGILLKARYERFNHLADLDQAMVVGKRAIQLLHEGHRDRPGCLARLGWAYLARFERFGNIEDIDESISAHREGVKVSLLGGIDSPKHLSNLGISFLIRFERLGNPIDLDESVHACEEAVQATLGMDINKCHYLGTLADALLCRFKNYGNILDLDRSIQLREEVVRLTPENHPERPRHLNNLCGSIRSRLKYLGSLRDADKSIALQKEALDLTPDDHPHKLVYLSSLGGCFLDRFEHSGDIPDIDQSVSLRKEAVHLSQNGHPDKPRLFDNLGNSLFIRYNRLKDINDLEGSVKAYEAAVSLIPNDHAGKPGYLGNFACSLKVLFNVKGDMIDLNRSISLHEEAIKLTEETHPYKPELLSNLGGALLSRFWRLKDRLDIDKGISTCRESIQFTPNKASYLHNLAQALLNRFQSYGDIADLDESISFRQTSVAMTPDTHPAKTQYLFDLGHSFYTRYQATGRKSDLNDAIHLCSQAANLTTGAPSLRFGAAQHWVGFSYLIDCPPPLEAYRGMMDLLPLVAWLGLGVLDRYRELTKVGAEVRDAAAFAIDTGDYDQALEWLEEGRSIVWGQMLQLRTPIHELRDKAPDLAAQFEKLSKEMESMGTNTIQLAGDDRGSRSSFETLPERRRQLTTEWETLVRNIRKVDGMNGFLLPKRVSQLAEAAGSGPVVVLNASKHRCDALILKSNFDKAMHIPLHPFTFERAQALQHKLMLMRSKVGVRQDDERAGRVAPAQSLSSDFPRLLSELWDEVVMPVLQALDIPIRATSNPSRIWWCGTGPFAFLPIHAAGSYDLGSTANSEPLIQLSDIVVSSYTPSVTALLKPHREQPSNKFKLLAIAQPSTPGQPHLPNTTWELAEIRKHLGSHSMVELEGADATIERVIESLSQCGWVHLACHGSQNRSDPTKSALMLEDGHLEIGRITRSVLPGTADFAFLSACQTASGDETLPEEVVHLAAGMLFAGYRSVIATMWSIRDKDAPVVADEVYRHLLSVEPPDSTEAARALHYAVARLRRESPEIPFSSWVPFIHIG